MGVCLRRSVQYTGQLCTKQLSLPHVNLERLSWPAIQGGDAFDALVQKTRMAGPLAPHHLDPPPLLDPHNDASLNRWLVLLAAQVGLEIEAVQITYAELDLALRKSGPALLRIVDGQNNVRLLALQQAHARHAQVVGPDQSTHKVPIADLHALLSTTVAAAHAPSLDALLARLALPPHRSPAVKQALLDEQIGGETIGGGWLIRLPPSGNLWEQLQRASTGRALLIGVSSYVLSLGFTLAAWAVLGRSALNGQFSAATFGLWALLLLAVLPLQMTLSRVVGWVSVHTGALLKQRLLFGITRLQPDQRRHAGAGHFFGQALDGEYVEQLTLTGGISALLALFQIATAGAVLAWSGNSLQAALLALWLGLILLLAWRYLSLAQPLSDLSRKMTNDLVERMAGHRTRLAQQASTQWHLDEDQQLHQYCQLSARVDRISLFLNTLVARGWMVIGSAACVGWIWTHPTLDVAQFSLQVGGLLLALQALTTFGGGARSLIDARTAWRQLAPIAQAARTPVPIPELTASWFVQSQPERRPPAPPWLLQAKALRFRYPAHEHPALQECTLQIRAGDRLLLEGPSGSGKSTLVSLLAGMRTPDSGQLLLWGMDLRTIGASSWKRQVAMAPQFHENHLFSESLAFNLLMGRRWPPTPQDLAEATLLCQELGLGTLLEQMPAGLQQMVGETGWQLSHGERSRVFIARTLLQGAELILLDESFAALDPTNLQHALACVLRRAPTVLVIAHP